MTSIDKKPAARHPFLHDMASGVTLVTNVLSGPVQGREQVLRIVQAVSRLYAGQQPLYLRDIDAHRTLFEYDANLVEGGVIHGVVVIDRSPLGEVTHLNIGFTPLAGATSIAVHLSQLLSVSASPAQTV